MWEYYQPNPCGRSVGDCSVRAVSAALHISWEDAYELICDAGYEMCDMPSSNSVWGAVLRKHGFVREMIPNTCPDCYTAEDFCKDYPRGTYVLVFSGHVATAINSVLYDSWDSSQEIVQYYWR